MLLAWFSLAFGADADRTFDRLTRRGERLAERTAAAEVRWSTACDGADPGDPATLRRVVRAERGLVGARYRQVCVMRRVEAWDAPEGEVSVFYATNRQRTRRGLVARDADVLEYGVATVYIPPRHPTGLLDRGLEVRAVEAMSPEAFVDAVSAARAAMAPDAEVLAYVHGYNNSFEYAARRAAQIAHDVDVPVVPVLFAWPSHGGEWLSSAKYIYDENAAARSSPMFAEVLGALLASDDEAPVNVMAHSMGSRIVADALLDLDRREGLVRPLADLVLAAPDVDGAVFQRRYLDLSLEAADRVTVYCAADDRALKLSRSIHGGYDRLGSCRSETVAAMAGRPGAARLDVVDASRLYVDLVDHDKVADSPRLLADLGAVLRGVPAGGPARSLVDRQTHFELPP